MVLAVDEDGSGEIEFPEFLDIVKGKGGSEKTKVITEFFQALTNGEFDTKEIAFPNYILEQRRQHLKNALMAEKGSAAQVKGKNIMNAVKKIMDAEREELRKEEAEKRKRESRLAKEKKRRSSSHMSRGSRESAIRSKSSRMSK